MRFHWLQSVSFEDAAHVGDWAVERRYEVTRTRVYADEPLPEVGAIDALAVMGGPMNVYQQRDFPWLVGEKRFIEQALGAGIPIIGICLGAQLIADVLGAKVVQNPEIEIGWHEVRLNDEGGAAEISEGLPERFTAFHWHGDTFEIPAGARHLAQSQACANQAFAYGSNVIGLQFHLEYSAESIEKMLAHCGSELVPGPFVQGPEQIIAGLGQVRQTQGLLHTLLDSLMQTEHRDA